MKKYLLGGKIFLFIICAFIAGSLFGRQGDGKNRSNNGRQVLYYVDPMNPSHTSDKPGIAPCGMKLEPVYADEGSSQQMPGKTVSSANPGMIKVSPEKQQIIGVKTAVIQKSSMQRVLRTTGTVTPDEARVYRLNAAVNGWIRKTQNDLTGAFVKKNQELAYYYAPDFLSAEQAYLYVLGALDRFVSSCRETPTQIRLTKIEAQRYIDSLRTLGMSESQIKEIARSRQSTEKIKIVAPASGFIIARNVSLGQRFEKGSEWYRIADLNRVWVLADCFKNEAEYIKPGMKARITVPHQKREFYAVVSNIIPQFDVNSRTLKVRLEMDNPGYLLKPGMFVDVEFPLQMPEAITVPADAVVDSGLRKTVFIDLGNGFFELRQVETGWHSNGQIEITQGLMEGERIVVSGTFLIDSESRMKAAAASMQTKAQTPEKN
ncbi:MAG: efflux RND transporter periplasmic adaptor subunit, partial [Smithella sp.]